MNTNTMGMDAVEPTTKPEKITLEDLEQHWGRLVEYCNLRQGADSKFPPDVFQERLQNLQERLIRFQQKSMELTLMDSDWILIARLAMICFGAKSYTGPHDSNPTAKLFDFFIKQAGLKIDQASEKAPSPQIWLLYKPKQRISNELYGERKLGASLLLQAMDTPNLKAMEYLLALLPKASERFPESYYLTYKILSAHNVDQQVRKELLTQAIDKGYILPFDYLRKKDKMTIFHDWLYNTYGHYRFIDEILIVCSMPEFHPYLIMKAASKEPCVQVMTSWGLAIYFSELCKNSSRESLSQKYKVYITFATILLKAVIKSGNLFTPIIKSNGDPSKTTPATWIQKYMNRQDADQTLVASILPYLLKEKTLQDQIQPYFNRENTEGLMPWESIFLDLLTDKELKREKLYLDFNNECPDWLTPWQFDLYKDKFEAARLLLLLAMASRGFIDRQTLNIAWSQFERQYSISWQQPQKDLSRACDKFKEGLLLRISPMNHQSQTITIFWEKDDRTLSDVVSLNDPLGQSVNASLQKHLLYCEYKDHLPVSLMNEVD